MYWFAIGGTALATWFDAKRMEIPNEIPVALASVAIACTLLGLHPLPWWAVLAGGAAAFAGSALLFALGALGGGDVKLVTALGMLLGPAALVPFVLLTGLAGGLLALAALRRGKREIAYAPAMLFGLLVPVPFVLLA